MCQNSIVPVTTSVPRMSEVTTWQHCVNISSCLRSIRSASAPPKSASARIGSPRDRPPMPRSNGELVIAYNRYVVAVISMKVPICETHWPTQ